MGSEGVTQRMSKADQESHDLGGLDIGRLIQVQREAEREMDVSKKEE
jgi:hypothetical protein